MNLSPRAATLALTCLTILAGCGRPNKANVALRRMNEQLSQKVRELEQAREADRRVIEGLQQRQSVGGAPTLPPERLAKLFTTHGLSFGKLTGGADLDRDKPGDEGLKVYVVPTDRSGQPIKAAGSFTVEAIDPSRPDDALVGRWEFPADQIGDHWYGVLMRYTYVLTCPWQNPPSGADLHVKVTFLDELTQTPFVKSVDVTVKPPAAAPAAATTTSAPAAP